MEYRKTTETAPRPRIANALVHGLHQGGFFIWYVPFFNSQSFQLNVCCEAPITATDQSCIHPGLVLHAYQSEKLLTFPDMLWLGASHDGHPRYSSLTSYVSTRWSASFTARDNAALWQAAMTFGVLEAITDLNIS